MNQLYIIICSLCIFFVIFLLDKYVFKSRKSWTKGISIFFLAVFGVRYFSYNDAFKDVIGLNGASGLSPSLVLFSTLFIWMYYACALLLVMHAFYDLKFTTIIIKFFALPVIIMSIIFVNSNCTLLFGNANADANSFDVIYLLYYFELACSLAYTLFIWYKDFSFSHEKGDKKTAVLAIPCLLFVSIQSYLFQVFFGDANPLYLVKEFTTEHRIFLYFGLIIPFAIYLILKNKKERIINFGLVFISLATMLSVCSIYKWDVWVNLRSWPLHLCNTAMFVIPLCLIFKMKRLFYFTYFINIMGAFLAMIMPNYSDVNMNSYTVIVFWINHYCAFFMPILLVALKQFERPKIKQFVYSMIAFCFYFVFILFVNAYFKDTDFFFLNSTFIADKLGTWAERMFDITSYITINGVELVFHPIYQVAFFSVYVLIALGMWFVYELAYTTEDFYNDMFSKLKKQRKQQIDLIEYAKSSQFKSNEEVNMNNICLELSHFTKKYGSSKEYAVYDANLKVEGGIVFGFLGPNGAGKSTIIKSIVGIQPITEGKINVCGYDCETQPVLAKQQIGYVPDHYALYEKLTGREYINYIADIYEVSQEDRTDRMNEMIELFELSDSINSPIKTYSHGMKQKITIMSALIHEPKVWILDEPLTGLDPNSIFQVKECMKRHAKKGNIVFFSSHIIDVVEKICDRIVIIKKGKLLVTRNVKDIEKEGLLEDFYMKTINSHNVVRIVENAEAKN